MANDVDPRHSIRYVTEWLERTDGMKGADVELRENIAECVVQAAMQHDTSIENECLKSRLSQLEKLFETAFGTRSQMAQEAREGVIWDAINKLRTALTNRDVSRNGDG